MALFGMGGGSGGRLAGLGGGQKPQLKLQDIRRMKQENAFFQGPPKPPDESLDYFVDPSVTGATTYTNQPPPAPAPASNAYRLAAMRAANRRPMLPARSNYLSGY
jgi:hypothetical protein